MSIRGAKLDALRSLTMVNLEVLREPIVTYGAVDVPQGLHVWLHT